VYVPTPVQPPASPRVRELSQRIQQIITDFQRQYPMTPGEIRQALLHAAGSMGNHRRPLAVALAAGIVAVLGVGVFLAQRTGGGEPAGLPIAALLGVLAAGVGLVVAIRRSR
jgi:hypothetical protein